MSRGDTYNNESANPGCRKDRSPGGPADDRMARFMPGALENAEEDEPRRDRGVKDAKEDQGWDHERERHFLVDFITKRSECRGRVVLISSVGVDDSTDNAENDDFAYRHGPERLGEIMGILHFGNETGEGDLPDESIRDVQESIHSCNKGCATDGNCGHNRLTTMDSSHRVDIIGVGIVAGGVGFDPGKDGSQQDGDECEERGSSPKFGESTKRPWK